MGLLAGDNLGLNSILGFSESFNNTYYCRFCKVSKASARIDFDEKKLREENYENDLIYLDPKNTGIKEVSAWDNVNSFETKKKYYCDWLHDGPEGAAGVDMTLILDYYINKKSRSL